jgi:integrase
MMLRTLKHSHVLTAIADRPDLSGKTINNYVSVLRDALARRNRKVAGVKPS